MTKDEIVELRNKLATMTDEHVVRLWENLEAGDPWKALVAAELKRRQIEV